MQISRLLRWAFIADAGATAATGLLIFTLSGAVEPLLGIPAWLLHSAGLALLPYAAVVAYLGCRSRVPAAAIWAVITANALWAIDSIALLFTGWIAPSAFGYGFVIGQATIVALFAEIQYLGLQKSTPAGLIATSRATPAV